jgi:hypothetical protein
MGRAHSRSFQRLASSDTGLELQLRGGAEVGNVFRHTPGELAWTNEKGQLGEQLPLFRPKEDDALRLPVYGR